MHLIQILLPLYDNNRQALPRELFDRVAGELTERFGGLTAYTRAPAEGLWKEREASESTTHDLIVIYEVMAESLDEGWWGGYRRSLERRFRQDVVVIRAQEIKVL